MRSQLLTILPILDFENSPSVLRASVAAFKLELAGAVLLLLVYGALGNEWLLMVLLYSFFLLIEGFTQIGRQKTRL